MLHFKSISPQILCKHTNAVQIYETFEQIHNSHHHLCHLFQSLTINFKIVTGLPVTPKVNENHIYVYNSDNDTPSSQ